jgi:transcriptional regulator with XRE-family HTH domain
VVSNSVNSSSNRPIARISLRHLKGWSQEALAFEAGLHRTFIAHVERQARNISLDNLERIAIALGVQAYELLMPP